MSITLQDALSKTLKKERNISFDNSTSDFILQSELLDRVSSTVHKNKAADKPVNSEE